MGYIYLLVPSKGLNQKKPLRFYTQNFFSKLFFARYEKYIWEMGEHQVLE